MKRFVGACVCAGLVHLGLLAIAARWSFVSALLSPSLASSLVALGFGGTFLFVRLFCLVALLPLAAGFVTFLGASKVLAGRKDA